MLSSETHETIKISCSELANKKMLLIDPWLAPAKNSSIKSKIKYSCKDIKYDSAIAIHLWPIFVISIEFNIKEARSLMKKKSIR